MTDQTAGDGSGSGSKDGARIAFVTGASRGIGKAAAWALADAGFDVVVTARTVAAGEEREHSPTVGASDVRPIPGNLEETAAGVRERGRRALLVPADLLDRASLETAAARVLDEWGHVDVIVHSGRYIGPGHMDRFLDTPIDLLQLQLTANVIGPLVLDQALLPSMLARGGGTIIGITSSAAYLDPGGRPGQGGWGVGYGTSKGAFHRIGGLLRAEFGDQGLRYFNVQPGVVITERGSLEAGEFGGFGEWGAPPEVIGAVVAWLATAPEATERQGATVEAQFLCQELGLLPSWPGPKVNRTEVLYDRSATDLEQLELAWRDAVGEEVSR